MTHVKTISYNIHLKVIGLCERSRNAEVDCDNSAVLEYNFYAKFTTYRVSDSHVACP